jgi:signal recognition particle receptor subunit beta
VDDVLPTMGQASDTFLFQKRTNVTLLDLGGAEKIRGIWPKYFAEIHGFLFVVDAEDSARFSEAKTCLDTVLVHKYTKGKPFVILANKADRTGAAGPEEIEMALELEPSDTLPIGKGGGGVGWHRVVSCAAIKVTRRKAHAGVINGIRALLSAVAREADTLLPRRDIDMAAHTKEADAARAAKHARVQKIRDERERKAAVEEVAPAVQAGEGSNDASEPPSSSCIAPESIPHSKPLAASYEEEGAVEPVTIQPAASAASKTDLVAPQWAISSQPSTPTEQEHKIPEFNNPQALRKRTKRNQIVPV